MKSLILVALFATSAFAQTRQDSPFTNINPSWSPDGKQLVFESSRHGNAEIYIINVDGTGERRLTLSDAGVDNTHPSWSPDGKHIVFDSMRDSVFSLKLIRPDGTDERVLTVHARHPEWSPDGKFIAFDSNRDGNGEIYVVRADGSGVRRITNTPPNESHPTWTPDGKIVFSTTQDGKRVVWAADPVTDARSPLPAPLQEFGRADFSPDGRHFVFSSRGGATPRLLVMRSDLSAPAIAITPEGYTSYESAWSPDGRRIAFYFDRTGKHELYVIDVDGRNLRQLTR